MPSRPPQLAGNLTVNLHTTHPADLSSMASGALQHASQKDACTCYDRKCIHCRRADVCLHMYHAHPMYVHAHPMYAHAHAQPVCTKAQKMAALVELPCHCSTQHVTPKHACITIHVLGCPRVVSIHHHPHVTFFYHVSVSADDPLRGMLPFVPGIPHDRASFPTGRAPRPWPSAHEKAQWQHTVQAHMQGGEVGEVWAHLGLEESCMWPGSWGGEHMQPFCLNVA